MHLWDKGGTVRESLIRFTCGTDIEYDTKLASYDIAGSMAHAVMLERCGLITETDRNKLLAGLSALLEETKKPAFTIGTGHEDIHSWVETHLKDLAGIAAGRLHTGRSRNDQVLTDIHLYIRHRSVLLAHELKKLAGTFLDLSKQNETVLMPGFTHMQAAMVSSFGLWFAAYAESLCDDIQALAGAAAFADASPLGTAAGYGTSLPVDRELTASLLKFKRLVVTSPYAQMSRGRTEKIIISAIASAANTLGRFSNEVILFMSPGFGFVTLEDDLTTGSSIMPQKKNPDLFELVRARCSRLQAMPGEVTMMTAGLPPGYNRDFQELKAALIDAFEGISELIMVIHDAVTGLVVNTGILEEKKYNDIYSAEEANRMVLDGIPFREAYKKVAEMAGSGKFRVPVPADYSHTGSIGNTGNELIRARLEALIKGFAEGFSPEELSAHILRSV